LLPLTLAGVGKLPCLNSRILCESISPKFMFEPAEIDFGKKIVTTPDKAFPKGL
jgi:hypothetical protein